MTARHVYLVRHGLPLVDVEAPVSEWRLDPAGVPAVRTLRRSGRLPDDALWFSSPEPRALATAELLTDRPITVVDGLREQVRLHVGWIPDFDEVLERAFADPDHPAYDGWEPLAATRRRVATAVRRLLNQHPVQDVVLVGHGTSLTLAAAELTDTEADPHAPAGLGFPDVVTVRMRAPARPGPLDLRTGLLLALALAVVELVAWKLTAHVGWALLPAGGLSALAMLPRRTRELGVTLLAAVLLSTVVVVVVLLGVVRMPA